MAERTIILKQWEARAFAEGRKTVIRRPVRYRHHWEVEERDDGSPWPWLPEYVDGGELSDEDRFLRSPFGVPGDVLALKETWAEVHPILVASRYSQPGRAGIPGPPLVSYRVVYKADGPVGSVYYCLEPPFRSLSAPSDGLLPNPEPFGWIPSVTMPRWAVRHLPTVVDIRLERLQDVTEATALAEGGWEYRNCPIHKSPERSIIAQWDEDYGKLCPSASNPWTWIATVTKAEP